MSDEIRHPEPELEVLWQRHIPQGTGDEDTLEGEEKRVGAVADLLNDLEQDLDRLELTQALDTGDLVVTVSRRPFPSG